MSGRLLRVRPRLGGTGLSAVPATRHSDRYVNDRRASCARLSTIPVLGLQPKSGEQILPAERGVFFGRQSRRNLSAMGVALTLTSFRNSPATRDSRHRRTPGSRREPEWPIESRRERLARLGHAVLIGVAQD